MKILDLLIFRMRNIRSVNINIKILGLSIFRLRYIRPVNINIKIDKHRKCGYIQLMDAVLLIQVCDELVEEVERCRH